MDWIRILKRAWGDITTLAHPPPPSLPLFFLFPLSFFLYIGHAMTEKVTIFKPKQSLDLQAGCTSAS